MLGKRQYGKYYSNKKDFIWLNDSIFDSSHDKILSLFDWNILAISLDWNVLFEFQTSSHEDYIAWFYCNIIYFVAKLQRDSREEIVSIYILIGEDHKIKSEYLWWDTFLLDDGSHNLQGYKYLSQEQEQWDQGSHTSKLQSYYTELYICKFLWVLNCNQKSWEILRNSY